MAMAMMKKPVYADLFTLSEQERIAVIGTRAMLGEVVVFIVETNQKADRYMRQLKKAYARVVEVDRAPGPVPNTVQVRVASGERAKLLREDEKRAKERSQS